MPYEPSPAAAAERRRLALARLATLQPPPRNVRYAEPGRAQREARTRALAIRERMPAPVPASTRVSGVSIPFDSAGTLDDAPGYPTDPTTGACMWPGWDE